MNEMPEILGVDIGGVILDNMPYRGTERDFAGENYLQTPEMPGAVETLAKLNKGRFKNRVRIVTRFNMGHGQSRVREWLTHRNFFGRTGLSEGHIYSCTGRHEKAGICEELGITHFVDDRAEVLGHMIGKVPNLYLFQSLDEDREQFKDMLTKLIFVESWDKLASVLGAAESS